MIKVDGRELTSEEAVIRRAAMRAYVEACASHAYGAHEPSIARAIAMERSGDQAVRDHWRSRQ